MAKFETQVQVEPRLDPLPTPPEHFVPTDEEIQFAHALQQEFLSNEERLDVLFERQVEILLTLHRNQRLLWTLDYANIEDFLNDPETLRAMRVKVGSRAQLYRLLALAEVHERFPSLQILREPHLTKLTHTSVLRKLKALSPTDVEKAADIVAETRLSNIQTLNSLPLPELGIKGNIVLIDGEEVLRISKWSRLTIRAVSKLAHFAPGPNFEIRDGKVLGWHNDQIETIGELLTTDKQQLEYVRDRLQAKQT
jgi:hypothetical protein